MQSGSLFNTWTSLFMLASALGLFLFISILFSKHKKSLPVAFLVLSFSVILFQYVMYWTNSKPVLSYIILLPHVCYYVTGPLLYLYFLNLYKKEPSFNYILHFSPAILVFIDFLAMLSGRLGFIVMAIPWHWFSRNPWLIAIHMAFYVFLIFRLFTHKKPGTEYEKLRSRWSKLLVILYSTFVLAYVSYYVLVNFSFFNVKWDYMISIMMTISIYAIGFFIIKEPKVFDGEFYTRIFLPHSDEDSSFEESLMNELFNNLTLYMEKEKPYTDSELRLINLADKLGFSAHLLSKVINKKSGKNFNRFINEYRLNEAKRLLTENPDYSIKSIYFEVGFSNKTTFYSAFKNMFNCTPSQFRDTVPSS